MRLDTAFRLSFFVTLGMACACLAQAEAFFHIWFPFVFLPLMALVFALAWRYEGRWVISETASNYLGVFIGLATGGWILLQLPRSQEALITGGVPWPAGLLPHLGPLLLVLLAVKLFRPKQLADAWVIQTIGLMLVTLACVLAGDPLFTLLLVGYFASLVWCLAIFHLYRARRADTATSIDYGFPKLRSTFLRNRLSQCAPRKRSRHPTQILMTPGTKMISFAWSAARFPTAISRKPSTRR